MYNSIEVFVYKQGRSFIANIDGCLYQLPYFIKNKLDVIRHFSDLSEVDKVEYNITFEN